MDEALAQLTALNDSMEYSNDWLEANLIELESYLSDRRTDGSVSIYEGIERRGSKPC